MAVRRAGVVGSALATALLGTFLYRAGPTLRPSSGPETGQSGAALPPTTEPFKKKINTKPTPPVKTQGNGTAAGEGPWLASQKHFAGRCSCFSGMESVNDKDQARAAPVHSESTVGNELLRWCIPKNEHVKAMIAVIPDPVQTHLALGFDRAIDAIELAAESTHYVLDRYWLPWDSDPKTDWTDYESFQAAKNDRDQKTHEPGLLMFRWDEEPEKARATVLYVFLVGETPTAGLNGEQFVKAVKYAAQLNGYDRDSGKGSPGIPNPSTQSKASKTYVLGPTSPASVAPLAALIEIPGPEKFVIRTIARTPVAIKDGTRKQFSFFITSVPKATHALIQRLATDHDIDNRQCQKAGEDQDPMNQVAVLSEAATTSGESFTLVESLGETVNDLDDVRDEGCFDNVRSDNRFDIFWYPREIASWRNASVVSSIQSPATRNNTAGPWPSLLPNFNDIIVRSDEPPDFSKSQSPLSKEAALMGLAAEMKRKHYRYIGINATNTLDVVFLIKFLRSTVPDARLFSFESDLLLEHEPDNTPYFGTLSVTTYPLLYPPLNQIKDQSGEVNPPGRRTRLPFTSQREEGFFNAAICTVRDMLKQRSREMLANPNLGLLSERGACPEIPNPPLWLTVVGAGGHWPIQALGFTPSPKLAHIYLPSSWIAVCILLCALAGLHILVLFGFLAPFSPKFRGFKLGTVAPARQLLGIHTASATLALALALVGLSAWRQLNDCIGASFLLSLLSFVILALTVRYFRRLRADETKAGEEGYLPPRPRIGIHTATLALASALVGVYAWRQLNDCTLARFLLSLVIFLSVEILPVGCWLLTRKYFRWLRADETKPREEWYLRPRPSRRTIRLQRFVFWGIWLGAVGLAFMWGVLLHDTDGYYGAFFSFRALHLASIVSPLAPMLPLLASIYIGAIFYIWHLLFNDKIRPRLKPSREKPPEEDKLNAWLRHCFSDQERQPESKPGKEKSRQEHKSPPGWRSETLIAKAVNDDVRSASIGLAILVLWILVFSLPQFELFERRWFQWLFEILFGLVMLLILVSGYRLGRIWQTLRRFLQDLNRQRASRVFSQLEPVGGWLFLWFYGGEDPDWDYMKQSHEVVQDLWHTPDKPPSSEALDAAIKDIHRTREQLQRETFFTRICHRIGIAQSDAKLEKAMSRGEDQLALVLNEVLDRLGEAWRDPEHKASERQRLLEKYVALRWFSFIRAVVARIRLLLLFLTIGFSLAMISLVIYSFEPHQGLLWSVTALFIVIGLHVLTVLIQMDRDPILSRIVGTEPGKLDLTLLVRVILLGVFPLLTLLATHFPSIGQSIMSFLQPGLEAMK